MRKRFTQLLDHMPIGIYQLNANDEIEYVNRAWLDLLGYSDISEVEGKSIKIVYAKPSDAESIRGLVDRQGTLKDNVVEVKRHNNERMHVALYSSVIRDADKRYGGRQGAVLDVTEREIYRKIMQDVPLGFYSVRKKDGGDKISYCNEQFAKMFEFPTREDAINFDILKLYQNPGDYDQFIKTLVDSSDNFIRHEPSVKTISGRRLTIESNVHCTKDELGIPIERSGVVRDLAQDLPLRELQNDLGLVLHTYTTTLIPIKHTIESVAEALGPAPFEPNAVLRPKEINILLQRPVEVLNQGTKKLLDLQKERNLYDSDYVTLDQLCNAWLSSSSVPEAHRYLVWRELAGQLAKLCDVLKRHKRLPRELLREVQEQGNEIVRVVCLILLRQREQDLLEIDHEVHALRAHVTSSLHHEKKETEVVLWDLVKQATRNLFEFAQSRGIQFKLHPEDAHVVIKANEHEVLRIINNLVHNAIKYSWSSYYGIRWIEIWLTTYDDCLTVKIENFGVPIPADEIDSGLIYSFGYRSRMSSERGRVGTGIGLADAKTVAVRYGGALSIESRPAQKENDTEDYEDNPFITTVKLTLPIHQTKEMTGE